jgi:hypothetical protein
MTAITIQQLVSWLGTQVMFGRAHTEILRGLLMADPSVRKVAPRFISMTMDAHAEESFFAARLVRSPHELLSALAFLSDQHLAFRRNHLFRLT